MTKEGKVDWNNTRIVWTVTIKKTSQTNNSLKGYKFSDDLKNAGPYVENSFKITDFNGNSISGSNPEIKDDTITCILPEATKDNVKISFMTSLNTDLEKSDIKNDFPDKNKYNKDILDKDGNKLYRKSERNKNRKFLV